MGSGQFSVYWWSVLRAGNEYEVEKKFVDEEEAVDSARRLTKLPSCLLVDRLIITDAGDCIVFEWTKKDGLVFPTKEDIETSQTRA